uniref:Uncharacterized protein n=1 Tax=Octopus bimaculoides TaxID=37653 RepID=A0A0L8I980_OCTBM
MFSSSILLYHAVYLHDTKLEPVIFRVYILSTCIYAPFQFDLLFYCMPRQYIRKYKFKYNSKAAIVL